MRRQFSRWNHTTTFDIGAQATEAFADLLSGSRPGDTVLLPPSLVPDHVIVEMALPENNVDWPAGAALSRVDNVIAVPLKPRTVSDELAGAPRRSGMPAGSSAASSGSGTTCASLSRSTMSKGRRCLASSWHTARGLRAASRRSTSWPARVAVPRSPGRRLPIAHAN